VDEDTLLGNPFTMKRNERLRPRVVAAYDDFLQDILEGASDFNLHDIAHRQQIDPCQPLLEVLGLRPFLKPSCNYEVFLSNVGPQRFPFVRFAAAPPLLVVLRSY
jgi:hypothetical protein